TNYYLRALQAIEERVEVARVGVRDLDRAPAPLRADRDASAKRSAQPLLEVREERVLPARARTDARACDESRVALRVADRQVAIDDHPREREALRVAACLEHRLRMAAGEAPLRDERANFV